MDRDQLRRYSRQILLPEVGITGQEKLLASSVLVIGAGGLGSPVLLYLTAAGVGRIGVADCDVVEPHNLQRQALYVSEDVGRPKVEAAISRLAALNPGIVLESHPRLEPSNALAVISDYDLIVDASDNFATRYLVNDVCLELGKPWVWGAAQGWSGMASVFGPGLGLRDAFPEPPVVDEDCDTLGVLGPLVGVVGSVMAGEAIKQLLGLETLHGRLWLYEAATCETRIVGLRASGSGVTSAQAL